MSMSRLDRVRERRSRPKRYREPPRHETELSRDGSTAHAGVPHILWRMRHMPPAARDSWATYVEAARERARLSKAELGRRIQVSRETVSRWESGHHRPESADVVARFAAVLKLDLTEALAAAGLRPDVTAPARPAEPADRVLDRIRASNLADPVKKQLIERELVRRAREEQARLEDVDLLIQSLEP